jgi:hypothetical protein
MPRINALLAPRENVGMRRTVSASVYVYLAFFTAHSEAILYSNLFAM